MHKGHGPRHGCSIVCPRKVTATLAESQLRDMPDNQVDANVSGLNRACS